MRTVRLKTEGEPKFAEAQELAVAEAGRHMADPMALAWQDRVTGRHSPDVDCCREEGKETWEIYAESRGGTLRMEVDGQYVFIFREGLAAS